MEKKTSQAYDAALKFIKQELLPNFRPANILTGFETALREMLIKNFPSATARGCWFHVKQVIFQFICYNLNINTSFYRNVSHALIFILI